MDLAGQDTFATTDDQGQPATGLWLPDGRLMVVAGGACECCLLCGQCAALPVNGYHAISSEFNSFGIPYSWYLRPAQECSWQFAYQTLPDLGNPSSSFAFALTLQAPGGGVSGPWTLRMVHTTYYQYRPPFDPILIEQENCRAEYTHSGDFACLGSTVFTLVSESHDQTTGCPPFGFGSPLTPPSQFTIVAMP